jgi:protein-disulfide isomerase
MASKEKNKEGENNKSNQEEQEAGKVNLTASHSEEDDSEGNIGRTLSEMEEEKSKDKKIKNVTSIAVILAGLFVGSLFVDVVQFVTKSGYSESALRNTNTFVLGDKTWVAYQEPAIQTKVLVAEDEEKCPECNPDQVLDWMKKFIPTMIVDKVSASSEEGRQMVERYGLKSIPAFTFEKKVEESDFFQEGQMSQLFEEKNGDYVLNATALGVPAGKYLSSPEIRENDAILGNKNADKKAVIFSDFQCPYSKSLYDTVKKIIEEKKDVAFVYKDMPLSLHKQSKNAALAAQCANDQGKFEEMADMLFSNQKNWSESEGEDVFGRYAAQIDLDKQKFDKCINEEKFKEKIENSLDLGMDFGITGTPAVFIGGELLSGSIEKNKLESALEGDVSNDEKQEK